MDELIPGILYLSVLTVELARLGLLALLGLSLVALSWRFASPLVTGFGSWASSFRRSSKMSEEVKRGPGRPPVLDMTEIARVWNESPNVIVAAATLGMSPKNLHAAVARGRQAGIAFKYFRKPRRDYGK